MSSNVDNKNESEYPSPYDDIDLDSEVDRGSVEVGSRGSTKKTFIIILFSLLAVLIIGISGVMFYQKLNGNNDSDVEQPKTSQQNNKVSGVESKKTGYDNWLAVKKSEKLKQEKIEKEKKEREEKERIRKEQEAARREAALQRVQAQTNTPKPSPEQRYQASTSSRNQEVVITPEMRKMSGDLMVATDGNQQTSSPQGNGGNSGQSLLGSIGGSQGGYDDAYNSPKYKNGSAYHRSEHSLDFLLQHGTVIPCALYTQIISDYQGYVTCRTTKDVYSSNGSTLLIERGSLLSGNQRMKLEPGKYRIFTTWSDVETTNGVHVNIDSLGAGRLGASGNEVWVDNHYAQRFGGAILLSFLDDVFEAVGNSLAEQSDSGITFDNSTDTAGDIAKEALKNSINISPTGYTKIGQKINIIVARDVDMSSVYSFE